METKANNFFSVLDKASNRVNWLCLALLLIVASNFSLLYVYHFGSITDLKEKNIGISTELKNVNTLDAAKRFPYFPDSCKNVIATAAAFDECKPCIKLLKSKLSSSPRITELDAKTNVASLPFIGLPMVVNDYVIIYFILGIVFFIWLSVQLNFCRNALKEFFNDPADHSITESHTTLLNAIFFIIFPLSDNRRFYKFIETVFFLFILSLIILLLSDLRDIFIGTPESPIPLIQRPEFIYRSKFILVRASVIITLIGISLFLMFRHRSILCDIRNLLILHRIQGIAFFPVLYKYFAKNGFELAEKMNHIGYRFVGNIKKGNQLSLVLTFKDHKKIEHIACKVDLASALKKFYKDHNSGYIMLTTEHDDKLSRNLTFEENRARHFVEDIFSSNKYTFELRDALKGLVDELRKTQGQ